MIRKVAEYTVRDGALEAVQEAIGRFVAAVRAAEPATVYDAYRLGEGCSFLHFMAFESPEAEEAHRRGSYTQTFVGPSTRTASSRRGSRSFGRLRQRVARCRGWRGPRNPTHRLPALSHTRGPEHRWWRRGRALLTSPSPGDELVTKALGSRVVAACHLALLGAGACAPAEVQTIVAERHAIEDTVSRLLIAHRVPGMAVAVVEDGEVRWTGGYGVRDAASAEPVTGETVFEAASLSKPVFAYVVLALARDGVVDLDRPLAAYLPRLAEEDPRARTITPRQILSHTAGLPAWFDRHQIRLESDPGVAWRYSGGGYVLLQQAIERATGEPLEKLARRLVFEPVRMTRSAFHWRDEFSTDAAVPHDSAGQPLRPARYDQADVDRGGAAYTLYTTAADFARFISAVSGQGSEPWLRPMFESGIMVDRELGLRWGLGWALQQEAGVGRAFHWGANPWFRAFAITWPRRADGWVALSNGPLGLELLDELSGLLTGTTPSLFRFYMLHPTD